MTEVVSKLEEYKGKKFDPSFYVMWDNFEPFPNQVDELVQKAKTLEPYTHKKFLTAQDEIKKRLDDMVKLKIEEEI